MPEFRMRDGTVVADRRLGRLVHFDPKSRGYPIRTSVAGKPWRPYTWRVGVWLHQGQEGSCTGFAQAHELCARPMVTIVNGEYARRIYFDAQHRDPWEGGAYPGAVPFYEGSSVLAATQACHAWGHFESYRWAFGLEDVILALGYAGPVVLGINWYEDMSNPAPDGRINPRGDLAGGHAILAYRVNVREKKVWLHNSWGMDWGIDGVCWLSFDDLDQLLHEDGEAVVPVKRKRPPMQARTV